MDIENVKALADIMDEKGLTSLHYSDSEIKVELRRDGQPGPGAAQARDADEGRPELDGEALNFNSVSEIKSPIVGVFYSAPSPELPPFVSIGSKVKKGDVLCIIEAMKLMNEIMAEQDGEIVDICLKSGDVAEYGQVLFKMF